MIIHIQKSSLFTVDPDVRFSKEHGVDRGVWAEMWRRHKLLGYDLKDICDLYEIRTGRKINPRTRDNSISRWIWRSEVFAMTKPLLKIGAQTVVSSFFKEHEEKVIKELTKNLKSSATKKSKILI